MYSLCAIALFSGTKHLHSPNRYSVLPVSQLIQIRFSQESTPINYFFNRLVAAIIASYPGKGGMLCLDLQLATNELAGIAGFGIYIISSTKIAEHLNIASYFPTRHHKGFHDYSALVFHLFQG